MNTNPLCDKGGAVVLLMTPKPRPNIVELALTAFLGGVVHEFRLAHVDDFEALRTSGGEERQAMLKRFFEPRQYHPSHPYRNMLNFAHNLFEQHQNDPAAVRYGIQPLQLTEPFPT